MGLKSKTSLTTSDGTILKIDDVEGAVYEIDNWSPEQSTTVVNHFTEKIKELKEAYEGLVEDFNWNKIIYESEMLMNLLWDKNIICIREWKMQNTELLEQGLCH